MAQHHDSRNFFLSGPVGRLEAVLWTPRRPSAPALAGLLCHPHPLFGGTMHNKVVFQAAKSIDALGASVLRFNFRGAGLSDGAHDRGIGERDDVRAALQFLIGEFPGVPLLVAGFSFGSIVGLRVGCQSQEVTQLIALGLPVNNSDVSFLFECPKPKLFVHGSYDEHGNVRVDQYYWLKDRNNPEVIKYLEDENAYTKAVMAHTEALQGRLYEELKGRVLQNDQSVPFREGNYFYYTRLVEGKNYPIYARKRGSVSAPEEIMIDANALAEGKATFLIRAWEISSAEDLLAFARAAGSTVFHPTSTCRMGSDGTAVVDERLRVRGIGNLRVVDASIMPTVVSGNTNAAVIMIAEKGADMILQDAGSSVTPTGRSPPI